MPHTSDFQGWGHSQASQKLSQMTHFPDQSGDDDVVDCKYVEKSERLSLISIIRDHHQRCIHFSFDHNHHHCYWRDLYFPLNCHQLSCCNVM